MTEYFINKTHQELVFIINNNNNNKNNKSQIDQTLSSVNDTVYDESEYIFRYELSITILLCIAYFIVFIIGVIGNVAVLIIVKKSPKMKTVTNKFIGNLAIADLLVNILCLPFTLAATLIPVWTMGTFFCKTVSYLQGVSVSASVNTLMAISIERCLSISCPLSVSMTSKQYNVSVLSIWSFAFFINIPWLYVFTLEPIYNGSKSQICIELWPSERTEHIYFVIANLLLCYLGPLTVITICYLIIWRKVSTRNIPGEYVRPTHGKEAINRNKLKVAKMIFIVIVTFALSWLPLYVIFSAVKFWGEILKNEKVLLIIQYALPIAQWLGASNSCINPILYAFLNRRFRKRFKTLFRKICLQTCQNRCRRDNSYIETIQLSSRKTIMNTTSSNSNNVRLVSFQQFL